MGQILLWAFLAYLLYNFIFKFVIPMVRVTRQVKRQVREFKQQTGGGFGPGAFQQGGFTNGGYTQYNSGRSSHADGQTQTIFTPAEEPVKKPETASAKKDDYIDFEEIK